MTQRPDLANLRVPGLYANPQEVCRDVALHAYRAPSDLQELNLGDEPEAVAA